MSGGAVQENMRFEAGSIGLTIGRANTEAENQIFSCTARTKECNNILYDELLLNRLDSSSQQKWWHQTYIQPFQGGRLQFRWIIKL